MSLNKKLRKVHSAHARAKRAAYFLTPKSPEQERSEAQKLSATISPEQLDALRRHLVA